MTPKYLTVQEAVLIMANDGIIVDTRTQTLYSLDLQTGILKCRPQAFDYYKKSSYGLDSQMLLVQWTGVKDTDMKFDFPSEIKAIMKMFDYLYPEEAVMEMAEGSIIIDRKSGILYKIDGDTGCLHAKMGDTKSSMFIPVSHGFRSGAMLQIYKEPVIASCETGRISYKKEFTLRELQTKLPWTIKYSEDFRKSPITHKEFAHALLHVTKATGKLAEFVNDMDHDKNCALDPMNKSGYSQYIADLVICALQLANTFPGQQIDLHDKVVNYIESKNGVKL